MAVIDSFPRRAFLRGLVALGASGLVSAPAIVRATSLDLPPVRHLLAAREDRVADWILKREQHTEALRHTFVAEPNGPFEYKGLNPVSRIFDGTAYNQKTGLWESGLSREVVSQRSELLTDSMPRSEWHKRRNEWVIHPDCNGRKVMASYTSDSIAITSPTRPTKS